MSKTLLKSTGTVSAMTLLSRISGLVRDIVLAQLIGTLAVADAFFVAFRIPNFLRRIFGEGAFAVAFVPVLADYRANRTPLEGRAFIDVMTGRLGLILLVLTALGVALAPSVVTVIAPGFLTEPDKFNATVDALRLTFPYLFFISLVAMSAGILNTCGRFAVPATTPILLNLCLIGAALGLAPVMHNAAVALGAGVFIAGVAQLVFQVPFLRREEMLPRPSLGTNAIPEVSAGREGASRVFRLMLPALFGTSVAQINLLVNTFLASFLVTGSVSWLYYSDRLMEFPLGVFGIALATVILPKLSEQHATQSMDVFSNMLDWALRWALLIGVPATVALVILAKPMLTTLFQYRVFSPHDVEMASRSLVAFSLGLVGYVLVKVLAPGFYARQDTRTPVRVGVIAMIVNVLVSLALVVPMAHVGLALAPSIAAIVNAWLLLRILRREAIYRPLAGWGGFALRIGVASAVMGGVLWWGVGEATTWITATALERIGRLAFWIVAGALLYFLGILLLGVKPRQLLLKD